MLQSQFRTISFDLATDFCRLLWPSHERATGRGSSGGQWRYPVQHDMINLPLRAIEHFLDPPKVDKALQRLFPRD